MRILCLHGRGSNNDIFQMQTIGFRSLLDDFQFEFVEGRFPHTEGNYSLYTSSFPTSKLWGYMDMLNPDDIDSAEREILQIAAEEGPFDGILGYSQGATLAAQVLIRYANENPFAAVEEMPFRFAILINGATPGGLFPLPESERPPRAVPLESIPEAALLFSVMTKTAGTTRLWPGRLSDGRGILTDGEVGLKLWNVDLDGVQIHVPTLHIRCLDDKSDYGEGLEKLCEPTLSNSYYHNNGHDFPRGAQEMRTIAQLIRQTAELAL